MANKKDLEFHFIDEHSLSRTRPKQYSSSANSSVSLLNKRKAKRKPSDNGEISWMLPEWLLSSDSAKRRRLSSPTVLPLLLSPLDDPVKPLSLHHDVALPAPVPTIESALPWDGHVHHEDHFNRDLKTSIEILSLSSTDSILVNSLQWDDSFMWQFLRSPSPDSGRTSQDDEEELKSNSTPDSDIRPSSANAGTVLPDDQRIDAPSEGLNKVRIRLRVKPEPATALPRRKIILRCAARKRQLQRTRRCRR